MECNESEVKSVALSREVVKSEGVVEEEMASGFNSEGAVVLGAVELIDAGTVEAKRITPPFRIKVFVLSNPNFPYPPAAIVRFLERSPLALMELCNTGEEEN